MISFQTIHLKEQQIDFGTSLHFLWFNLIKNLYNFNCIFFLNLKTKKEKRKTQSKTKSIQIFLNFFKKTTLTQTLVFKNTQIETNFV